MLYVGKYPQIYPHTILGLGNVSRDGLPRGTLPSGIFKLEKYCPGLKVRHPWNESLQEWIERGFSNLLFCQNESISS